MWLLDQILNKKLDSRLAAFLLEEGAIVGTDDLKITHEQLARHLRQCAGGGCNASCSNIFRMRIW